MILTFKKIYEMFFLKRLLLVLFYTIIIGTVSVEAQPKPGDIYKNYFWIFPEDSGSDFLRVIGDGDYRDPVYFSENYPVGAIDEGWINLPFNVDLKKAVKAEIQVEKLLSHDGTRKLSVKVNNSGWYEFPESEHMPKDAYDYLYHTYPVVDIPLNFIKKSGNKIRFTLDSIQRFNMPQNILYGVHLRVYYKENKPHITADISGVLPQSTIGDEVNLSLSNIQGEVEEVHYLGLYEDVNYETDGNYYQWHYTYFKGELRHQLGKSLKSPFSAVWNTSWIPNQTQTMKIAALIKSKQGVYYFTPPVEGLGLHRNFDVTLCKPYDQPKMWATREQVFNEKVRYLGNPKEVEAFQIVFSSWSPAYMNGVYLNDWLLFVKEGKHYYPGFHRKTFKSNYMLKQGENIIKTGLTPYVNNKMVHGAEILYPGIMLLVKSPKKTVDIEEVTYKGQAHFKVSTASAIYYIEKQSGGCSSLIDTEGNDWINFKKTGNSGLTLSSDSDYRGLPNLVFGEPGDGIGHPGFNQCTTVQISDNSLQVTSKDGAYQFRWVFDQQFARVVIDRFSKDRKYWFLFEGPIAGKFNPKQHYWGNDQDGVRQDDTSIFKNPISGHWQWVFFGDQKVDRTLFLMQKNKDNHADYFTYMGNSNTLENLSKDGMNVFGFGRGLKTNPLLQSKNTFYIGFYPKKTNNTTQFEELKSYLLSVNEN